MWCRHCGSRLSLDWSCRKLCTICKDYLTNGNEETSKILRQIFENGDFNHGKELLEDKAWNHKMNHELRYLQQFNNNELHQRPNRKKKNSKYSLKITSQINTSIQPLTTLYKHPNKTLLNQDNEDVEDNHSKEQSDSSESMSISSDPELSPECEVNSIHILFVRITLINYIMCLMNRYQKIFQNQHRIYCSKFKTYKMILSYHPKQ